MINDTFSRLEIGPGWRDYLRRVAEKQADRYVRRVVIKPEAQALGRKNKAEKYARKKT